MDRLSSNSRRLGAWIASVLILLAGAAADPPRLVGAQGPAERIDDLDDGLPRFGLAHVDLMDLHLSRRPDGSIEAVERQTPAELAERYERAVDAGAGWNRWSLYWDMVEHRAGSHDWQVADEIVARDQRAGLHSLLILQGTPGVHAGTVAQDDGPDLGPMMLHPALRSPSWLGPFPAPGSEQGSRTRPRAWEPAQPQAAPPAGLDRPIFLTAGGSGTDDPALAARVNPGHPWANFVVAAARRYMPGGELARSRGWPDDAGVRHWEIGNEPNLTHFWSGTAAEFARYLEVAYLSIHWVDPEATVLHGGIADEASAAGWYRQFLSALRQRAARTDLVERHGWYFDAAAWHWYVYPNLLLTGPAQARALLSEQGLPAKPLWVTEMGMPIWNEHPGPCWDPVSPWRGSTAEQAGYVWQALAEGVGAGLQRMFLFQLYDDCGNGPGSYDAFGLVRNTSTNQCWNPPEGRSCWRLDPEQAGQPRPAHAALAWASEELAGAELLWRPARDANFTQRLLFYRPPDTRVQVVFNWLRADRPVELFATGTEATVLRLDSDGWPRREQLQPEGGRLHLTLPGTTNRNNPGNQSPVLAGRPVIILEQDRYGPFRASLHELPESVEAGDLELWVDAADGGTGVAEFQIFLTRDRAPTSAAEWQPAGEPRPWPADPLTGSAAWTLSLEAGRSYWFAARARDRAGNWSSLPDSAQAWTSVAGPVPATATESNVPTATPTLFGSSTPTAANPTPGITPSPTRPASDTPVPSPTEPPVPESSATSDRQRRLLLPWLALRQPRSDDGMADCRNLLASVVDPLGRELSDPGGGRWFLTQGLAGDTPWIREAALGQSICADPLAALGIRAEVSGHVSWPEQPLRHGWEIRLARLPNALSDGDFEAGQVLEAWRGSGSSPARSTDRSDLVFSGRSALLGGSGFVGQPELGGGGNSTLSQVLSLPPGHPHLSGQLRLDATRVCSASGCHRPDRFEVILVADEDPRRPAHYLEAVEPLPADSGGAWIPFAFDLSAWAGQRVEILFNLYQPDADEPSRALLDNLAVSLVHPRPEPPRTDGRGIDANRSLQP